MDLLVGVVVTISRFHYRVEIAIIHQKLPDVLHRRRHLHPDQTGRPVAAARRVTICPRVGGSARLSSAATAPMNQLFFVMKRIVRPPGSRSASRFTSPEYPGSAPSHKGALNRRARIRPHDTAGPSRPAAVRKSSRPSSGCAAGSKTIFATEFAFKVPWPLLNPPLYLWLSRNRLPGQRAL